MTATGERKSQMECDELSMSRKPYILVLVSVIVISLLLYMIVQGVQERQSGENNN